MRLSKTGVQLVVEPAAKPCGHLELGFIGYELDDIPGAVQNRGAVLAHLEVRFHAGPQFGIDSVVDIVRYFAANFEATYFGSEQESG